MLAALATCLILGGLAVGGLFQILWRLSDFDNVVVVNAFYSFTVMMIAAGIFILITTPNLFGKDVLRWTQVRLEVAWFIVIVAVLGVTVISPDLRWLATALKPILVGKP